MSVEKTIKSIFSHLSGLDRPIAAKRRDGIDEKVVLEKLLLRGLQCPSDFLEAYRSCDGTETNEGDTLDEIQFFPGYYWISLDEALTTYDTLVSDERWNAGWLPIFANGGGDFYSIICDAQSQDFGGVAGFILGESDHLVEFKNLTTLLETIEQSFSEGAFFVSDGCLEANYAKMRMIAKQVQPDFVPHDA